MKPVKLAILLEQFVANVDNGQIAAPQRFAARVLKNMRTAAQAILDGADPDVALGIERGRGAARKPLTFMLALAIANSHDKGEKWVVIEAVVNNFLKGRGESTLSLARIKKLPKDHAAEIQNYRNMQALRRDLAKALPEKAR